MLKNKHFWSAVMMVLIIAFDQVTKWLAKTLLPDRGAVPFIRGVVEFTYSENTGVAFSMLSGARWLLIALTGVVAVGCTVYMYRSRAAKQSLWLYWTLGVIISGAFGNLIDRVRLGYVIDFINPVFVDFAVFNIAGCAITLGTVSLVAYLVCDMAREAKREKESADEQADLPDG